MSSDPTSDNVSLTDLQGYLEGNLSARDQERVQQLLNADPDAREALEVMREALAENPAIAGQLADFETAFSNQVSGLSDQVHQRQSNTRRIGMAAAILLVITVPLIIWMLSGPGSLNPTAVFAQHFEPYEDLTTVRSDQPGEESRWSMAMERYNNANFTGAAQLLSQVHANEPEDDKARFYLGVSLLANGLPNQARPHFQALADQSDHEFNEPARWYLALTQLAMENLPGTQKLLNEIKVESGPYAERASDLLQDLNL